MIDHATEGAGMRFAHVTEAGRAIASGRGAGGAPGAPRLRRMSGVAPFTGLGPVRGGL